MWCVQTCWDPATSTSTAKLVRCRLAHVTVSLLTLTTLTPLVSHPPLCMWRNRYQLFLITFITYLPLFKLLFQKPHLTLVILLIGLCIVKFIFTGFGSKVLNFESPIVVDRTLLAGFVFICLVCGLLCIQSKNNIICYLNRQYTHNDAHVHLVHLQNSIIGCHICKGQNPLHVYVGEWWHRNLTITCYYICQIKLWCNIIDHVPELIALICNAENGILILELLVVLK